MEWESRKFSGEFMEWNLSERALKTEIDTRTEQKIGVGKLGWFMSDINRNIPTTWRWAREDDWRKSLPGVQSQPKEKSITGRKRAPTTEGKVPSEGDKVQPPQKGNVQLQRERVPPRPERESPIKKGQSLITARGNVPPPPGCKTSPQKHAVAEEEEEGEKKADVFAYPYNF